MRDTIVVSVKPYFFSMTSLRENEFLIHIIFMNLALRQNTLYIRCFFHSY